MLVCNQNEFHLNIKIGFLRSNLHLATFVVIRFKVWFVIKLKQNTAFSIDYR
jgi:hypothetical protein